MAVVDSLLGLMNSEDVGSWLVLEHQSWISSYWVSFTSNYIAVGHTQDISTTIAQLGTSCWYGLCCGLQVLQLTRTTDCFSSMAAWIASLDTVKTIPQGDTSKSGQFHLNSSKSCIWRLWCLQLPCLIFRFWKAIKREQTILLWGLLDSPELNIQWISQSNIWNKI